MALMAIVVVANCLPLGWLNPVPQGSSNYLRDGHARVPRPVHNPQEWAREHETHGVPVYVSGAENVDFVRQELGIDVSALEGELPHPLDKDQYVLIYSPESKVWWQI